MQQNPEHLDILKQASKKGFGEIIDQLSVLAKNPETKKLLLKGVAAMAEQDEVKQAEMFAEIVNELVEKNPKEVEQLFNEIEKDIQDGRNPKYESVKRMAKTMTPEQLKNLDITQETEPELLTFLSGLSPKVRVVLLKQINAKFLKHADLQVTETKEGLKFTKIASKDALRPGELEFPVEIPEEVDTTLDSLLSSVEIDKDTLQIIKKGTANDSLANLSAFLIKQPAEKRSSYIRAFNKKIREKFPFIPADYDVFYTEGDSTVGLQEGGSLSQSIGDTQMEGSVLQAPEGASDSVKQLYALLNALLNMLRDGKLKQGDPVVSLEAQLKGLQKDRSQIASQLQLPLSLRANSIQIQQRNALQRNLQNIDGEIVIVNGQIQEINTNRDMQMRKFGSQIHGISGLENARVLRDGSFITILDTPDNMNHCIGHIRGRGYEYRRVSSGCVRVPITSRDIPTTQKLFGKDVCQKGIAHRSMQLNGHVHHKYTETQRVQGWIRGQKESFVERRDTAQDAAVRSYRAMTGKPYSYCKRQVAKHIEDSKYAPENVLPTAGISPYSQAQYNRAYQIRLAAQGELDKFDSLQKRYET